MKTDVQQFVGQRSVCFNIYVSVVPENLKAFEQSRGIEQSLKRELSNTLLEDPDVFKKKPLVVVDCGWDSELAEKYKAKRKTFHIEAYFLLRNQGLPWESVRETAKEVLKGVEATVLRVLLENDQVIVPQKV